ncbi:MAG: hypothetical protein MSC30_02170 [Gaiellaceae bacterium MAG52_C11]|nr:hypothetical protein [Candidatus Gaiellasilicea maunaloa]
MSAQSVDDALVAALARASVERAAPEELPLFRATSTAYFENPAALEQRRSRDEMLGFGVDAAVMLVTPVALAVAKDVIEFIGTQLRARAEKEGEGAIDRVLNRLLRRDEKEAASPEPAGVPELTDEQLEQVRALALEKAKQLKLSDAKAELLAESLVGSLATA